MENIAENDYPAREKKEISPQDVTKALNRKKKSKTPKNRLNNKQAVQYRGKNLTKVFIQFFRKHPYLNRK